jgi:N-acetylmuramoyl-L-alanine amidase
MNRFILYLPSVLALILMQSVLQAASGADGFDHWQKKRSRSPEPSGVIAPYAPLPSAEVIIDAGHGGIDGGTSHGSIMEKDINLQVARKLYARLLEKRYSILLNRTGDYALSDENRWLASRSRHQRDLAQRKQLTEEIPTQALVSLHVNWSDNSRKFGPLVLYQQGNPASYLLASHIQHQLNALYGTRARPKVGKTYYLLNRSVCPAVIVEMGFLSHAGDRERLTDPKWQERISLAITQGIQEYFLLLKE